MQERFEFLRFDDRGELKIKDHKTGHWAWFARDGSIIRRGTATEDEIEQWSKRAPAQFSS